MYLDSAIAGSDYLSLNNAQIIIPVGSVRGTAACINFSIVDDNEFEQEEMFMVEWTPHHDNRLSFDVTTSREMIDVLITDNDGMGGWQRYYLNLHAHKLLYRI